MARPRNEDLPIFVKWIDFLKWLLPTTEKFPKRVRFTFADRINTLALDIVEDLVEARYAHNKQEILQRTSLRLEKIRVLLRLAQEQHDLSFEAFEFAMRQMAEVGRMLGGWMKQQKKMKKAGHLFNQVTAFGNLKIAGGFHAIKYSDGFNGC